MNPPDRDDPVFAEPWEAQLFALTEHLRDQGIIEWADWTRRLSSELHHADATHDGSDYFGRWLTALERLLVDQDIADRQALEDLAAAWQRAAHATPHGLPIRLENDPHEGART